MAVGVAGCVGLGSDQVGVWLGMGVSVGPGVSLATSVAVGWRGLGLAVGCVVAAWQAVKHINMTRMGKTRDRMYIIFSMKEA
jgi:hypothetical protein